MPTKNDVLFIAGNWKKDNIFGGHLNQISDLLISLGLYYYEVRIKLYHGMHL